MSNVILLLCCSCAQKSLWDPEHYHGVVLCQQPGCLVVVVQLLLLLLLLTLLWRCDDLSHRPIYVCCGYYCVLTANKLLQKQAKTTFSEKFVRAVCAETGSPDITNTHSCWNKRSRWKTWQLSIFQSLSCESNSEGQLKGWYFDNYIHLDSWKGKELHLHWTTNMSSKLCLVPGDKCRRNACREYLFNLALTSTWCSKVC